MDHRRGGCSIGLLPPTGSEASGTQYPEGGVVSVTPEERLAAIEASLQQLFVYIKESTDRVNNIGEKLEIVARLEERYHSVDHRVNVLSTTLEMELARRTRIDENLFDRVRIIENQSGLNTQAYGLMVRIAIPAFTTLIGALVTYLTMEY